MSEIGQSTDDAVVAPARVLSSHADNQSLDLCRDRGTTWIGTALGTVKLLSNQSPVPSQDRIWERDGGDRLQIFSANPFTNLRESRTFRIRQAQTRRQMRAQD